jgi:hypothetical protein
MVIGILIVDAILKKLNTGSAVDRRTAIVFAELNLAQVKVMQNLKVVI